MLSVMALRDRPSRRAVARLQQLIEEAGFPLRVVEEPSRRRCLPGSPAASTSASPTVARSRRSRGWISIPWATASMPTPSRPGRLRRRRAAGRGLGLQPRTRPWQAHRAPGEFLLGYENEDGELPDGPPAPLGPNGTFMVYREIGPVRRRASRRTSADDGGRARHGSGRAARPRSSDAGRTARRWRAPRARTRHRRQPPASERLPLRGRSLRARLPARSARAPREPARRAAGRRRADDAPSDHPARHALRATEQRGEHGPDLHLLQREHRATGSSSSSATGSTPARRSDSGDRRLPAQQPAAIGNAPGSS